MEVHVYSEDDEDDEDEAVEGEGEAGERADGQGEPAHRKTPKHESQTILPEYSDDELDDVHKDIVNGEITQLEEELGKQKPNLNVLAEYRKREAEFLDRGRDLENVTNMRDEAKKRYDDLRKTRLEQFMAGFTTISSKLKEMYQVSG